MRWADVASRVPRLAERMGERLLDPGVVLVGTTRRDGTPRISPVEPFVLDGDLWLSMMWGSAKAADLDRDDRVLVHSIVTGRDGADGEVKVRGRAVPVRDAEQRQRYCDAVQVLGWRPEEPWFHLFVVDIAEVTSIRYDPAGDQYVARWPEGVEFVRRETSATSVGAREPHRELLTDAPAD